MHNSAPLRSTTLALTVGSTNVMVGKVLVTPGLGAYEGHSKTNVQKLLLQKFFYSTALFVATLIGILAASIRTQFYHFP
jgi:hypothetical protein